MNGNEEAFKPERWCGFQIQTVYTLGLCPNMVTVVTLFMSLKLSEPQFSHLGRSLTGLVANNTDVYIVSMLPFCLLAKRTGSGSWMDGGWDKERVRLEM
jgi:hypothetical protein